jgi:ABC-2 type transport system permease protein
MAASIALEISTGRGWLVGFRNMVNKEYASWWRTRRWMVHVMLWLFVINAFLFLIGTDEAVYRGHDPYATLGELLQVFFQVGGLFATIGIIVVTQSAVVGERELGTAEWVLSKPVSRPAFLLSKLLVNGLSFLFLAVAIPSVVFFLQSLLHAYLQPPLVPFLAGIGMHVLHLVFYLTLTLALGTFFQSRGPVSGIAVGLVFAGLILPNFFPSTMSWTPWGLMTLAARTAREVPLPDGWYMPLIATSLWSLLFVLLALRRFEGEEL